MKLSLLRREAAPVSGSGVAGVARVDRRTKNLTKRLQAGEVAVIDHLDIDKVSADALVACRPVAVLNASPSISGRYPNLGPQIIVDARIPLIDNLGPDLVSGLVEGAPVRLTGCEVWTGDRLIAKGQPQDECSVAAAMEEARAGLAVQLEAFAANTMDYLQREKELLLDGVGIPQIRTSLEGRQALIVVRGYHYKEDLAMLKPYIREYRPVLIGVDGGADAILEAGYSPHLIVGDMDSVSDRALNSGAELVVHAYRDGRAPGLSRLEGLGLQAVVFPATGTSEDVAMLLADDMGASLIVAVGTHATLVEFLDKGRAGMASTFLTRLRVGGKLVEPRGVSRLYRQRISNLQLVVLVLAGLFALAVAMDTTQLGQVGYQLLATRVDGILSWMRGWFVDARPEALVPYLHHPPALRFPRTGV